MSGRSIVAQETNRKLDKILVGINKAYQDVCDKDSYVTAEKVRNSYLGMGMNHKTLLAVFRKHNEDYAKITAQKMSDDMEKLSQRIQSVENIICQTI